jgi:hypothetical protein
MSKTKENLQDLADLGQGWDFLSDSLSRDKFEGRDMDNLQSDIEDLIYAQANRVTIAQAVGVLEVVKHKFLNQQD